MPRGAAPYAPYPGMPSGNVSSGRGLWLLAGMGVALGTLVLVALVALLLTRSKQPQLGKRQTQHAQQTQKTSTPAPPTPAHAGTNPLPAGASGPQDQPAAPAAGQQNASVSQQEARQFAQKLAQAFAARDVATINGMIDWDALLARAIQGIDLPRAFRQGMEDGVRKKGLSDMVRNLGSKGKATFLWVKQRQGYVTVVFRYVTEKMALSYLEFMLDRRQGRVVAVDVYNYALGGTVSQLLRRSLAGVTQHLPRGALSRLLGASPSLLEKHWSDYQAAVLAISRGDYVAFNAAYRRLPEELRRLYMIQMARLQLAARSTNSAFFLEAYQDFVRYFPNDPSLSFMSIDFYLLQKQFDKALEHVRKIRQVVGDDPYLDFLEGNLYLAKNQPDMALQKYRSAIAKKLDLPVAHLEAAAILLKRERFAELANVLHQLVQQHQAVPSNVENLLRKVAPVQFRKFQQSPEYRQWRQAVPQPAGVP